MSIYDFSAILGTGETRSLADFRGKALLVVNVASNCGFTPQYKGLQSLWDQLQQRGFEILAFPWCSGGCEDEDREGQSICNRHDARGDSAEDVPGPRQDTRSDMAGIYFRLVLGRHQ